MRSVLTKDPFTIDGVPYPFLDDFEIVPQPYGGYTIAVVFRNKRRWDDRSARRGELPAGVPLAQIASNIGNQLATGVLDINFDSRTHNYIEPPIDDNTETTHLAMHRMRQEFNTKLAELSDENQRLRSKLRMALKTGEKLAHHYEDAKVEADAALEGQDLGNASAKSAMQLNAAMAKDVAGILSAAQSSDINRSLTDDENMELVTRNREMSKQMASTLGKDEREIEQKKTIGMLERGKEMASPARSASPKRQPKEEKEEEGEQ